MPQRFILTNVAVTTGGTAFTHGLTSDRGVTAVVPNEWHWNCAGVPAVEVDVYRNGAATTGALTVAASSATVTVDVFAAFNHSTIR